MSTKERTKKTKPTQVAPTLPTGCDALLSKMQICFALGISIRTFANMLADGAFPRCNARLGKYPRWHVKTLNAWIEAQCNKGDTSEASDGRGVQEGE